MNIRDRLGGFIGWPLSRKLFLLGSTGVVASTFAVLVNALLFSAAYPSAMDLGLLNRYMVAWIIAQLIITAAAIPAARAGSEGRSAARLFVMVQSPFIVGLLHLYGTMGTPLVAIYPAIVILWTLVLDERLGLFGFGNLVAWMVIVGALETAGVLTYAPMLVSRTIDAQNNPVWFVAVFMHILTLTAFCTSLAILFQRTRLSQESRMAQARESLEQANRLIRRYVPARLAEQICAGEHEESDKPERRKLTIAFVGIADFVGAAEELEAEDLAAALGEYLSTMVAIADRHDGTISHVLGDRLLVLFGAPHFTDDHDHALRAVAMAQEMHAHAHSHPDLWSRRGLDRPLRLRIAINTGYVSVGAFGSPDRKLYSGIGLQTHVADHIYRHSAAGETLISHSTWSLVQDEVPCASQTELAVDGLNQPLRVYAVIASDASPAAALLQRRPEPALLAHDAPLAGNDRNARAGGACAWQFGDACFDEGSLVLTVAGEVVELERKPLEVLRMLLHSAGDVVTKDELVAAVWPGRIPSETVVAKCVSRLREVLHDDGQTIIKTVHGYGYRLIAEVRPVTSRPMLAPSAPA